jgi:D-alanyl-D-alanine carboxypeptidase
MRSLNISKLALIVLSLAGICADAALLQLPLQQQIDKAANEVLAKTGVPSASIAVVKDGQIAYIKAYGMARLSANVPATPKMRYSIGSISKQFTATAILLLQEQGKLSLDDKVARFFPKLTRAHEVTIRQLLSHTAGYQDYWPQDYLFPLMLKPTTPQFILDIWASKALDFEPGVKWQYSNTNFVIAGLIIEKASGMPLLKFLQQKVFAPLGMKTIADIDSAKLGDTDPAGYIRYALGPLRPAPKEGTGWLFAMAELAMTAEDLAKWDLSIIEQTLLKPPSYREFEREILLKNGLGTKYGLGVAVDTKFGHRAIYHSGEVSGFVAENFVFPDERVAIVVLTNQDASSAAAAIADVIAPLLLAIADPKSPEKLVQARKIFEGLQHGTLERSLFTDNANYYFSNQALQDFSKGLAPLGKPEEFKEEGHALRGGMTLRAYSVKFPKSKLRAWTYEMPDGKLEQYLVAVVE